MHRGVVARRGAPRSPARTGRRRRATSTPARRHPASALQADPTATTATTRPSTSSTHAIPPAKRRSNRKARNSRACVVIGVAEEVSEGRLGDERRLDDVEDSRSRSTGATPAAPSSLHRTRLDTWMSARAAARPPAAQPASQRRSPVTGAATRSRRPRRPTAPLPPPSPEPASRWCREAAPRSRCPRTRTVSRSRGRGNDTTGGVPRLDLVARDQQPHRRRQHCSGRRRDEQQGDDLTVQDIADTGLREDPHPAGSGTAEQGERSSGRRAPEPLPSRAATAASSPARPAR